VARHAPTVNYKQKNKQITTMQKKYASPGISIYRVAMETALAAGPVVSVQTTEWATDEVIGDAAEEGGDIYIAW
jgi:hypothetical protein